MRRMARIVRQGLAITAITVLLAVTCLGALEFWLRSASSPMGRPLEFAQADFYPYLGIANLFPLNPQGVLEREYGYHKGAMLYQHRKAEQIRFSGDRFQPMFQLADGETDNPSAFRIYVVGSSVAHAGNVPLPERYFSWIQRTIQARYPVQLISTGKGGAASTEELVLFTLSVLPDRPDMILVLDGLNDFALGSTLGVRPGDPFNSSVMYSKHYDLAYNFIRWGVDNSYVARLVYQAMLRKDLADNLKYLQNDPIYRSAKQHSLISIYLHNLRTMVDICEGLNIPIILAPQPAPDLLLKRMGEDLRAREPDRYSRIKERIESLPTSPYRDADFIAQAYDEMLSQLRHSPTLARHFVDIQDSVDLDNFVDWGHQNAQGQKQLADALSPAIAKLLPLQWSPAMRDQRSAPWP